MLVKNNRIGKYTAFLLGTLFLLTACGPREIPDDKMEGIIHDIFLVNAYVKEYRGDAKIDTDSTDIYTPVFKKYGYTADDFRYSMERMALKKSSRLGELIDNATSDIKIENAFYEGRARILERVDSIVATSYQDTVLFRPDSVWFKKIKLKDSLKISLPATEGKYYITYDYMVDTTDNAHFLTARYKLLDSLGKSVYGNSRTITRGGVTKKMDISFHAESKADTLELILADYPKAATRMAIRIDSLLIVHEIPLKEARSRYWRDQLYLYSREKFSPYYESIQKDSSTLYIVPPLRPDTTSRTDL